MRRCRWQVPHLRPLLVVIELEVIEEHIERLARPSGAFLARLPFWERPLSDALRGLEAAAARLQIFRRAALQRREAAAENLVLRRRLRKARARRLSSLRGCAQGGRQLRWVVPHADVTGVVRDLGHNQHHEFVELAGVRDEVHAIEAPEVV